jgi:hypothetical protein
MWRSPRSHAPAVRPASAGCRRRQEAVVRQRHAVWEPCGLRGFPPRRGVGAAEGPQAGSRGQGASAAHREHTPPSANVAHASWTSHSMFFSDDDHTRAGDRPLHPSLCVWDRPPACPHERRPGTAWSVASGAMGVGVPEAHHARRALRPRATGKVRHRLIAHSRPARCRG